jgi:hypothetical protein
MTKSKGQIGKGERDRSQLSSDERARLGGSKSTQQISGADPADGVKVVAVEAHCGIHQWPFLLYIERKDGGWEVQRAYSLPDSQDVVHTRTPAVPEGIVGAFSPVPLKGKIVAGSERGALIVSTGRYFVADAEHSTAEGPPGAMEITRTHFAGAAKDGRSRRSRVYRRVRLRP